MKQSYAHCDLKQQWNAINISMIKKSPALCCWEDFFFLDQAVSVSRPHAGERLFLFKNSFSTISSCHRMQYLSWRDKFVWPDISFSFPYTQKRIKKSTFHISILYKYNVCKEKWSISYFKGRYCNVAEKNFMSHKSDMFKL